MGQNQDNRYYEPIVITLGDPCGVGPEVVHSAVKQTLVLRRRELFVVGDLEPFTRAIARADELQTYNIVPFDDFLADCHLLREEFKRNDGAALRPYFIDLGGTGANTKMGEGSPGSGELALAALDAAFEILESGISSTLVTGPISKKWVYEAGFDFPGHTEALAEYFRGEPLMILVGGGLRVGLVTIHEPIAKVPELLTKELIREAFLRFEKSLRLDFGFQRPRIALCGLNPHAGEGGEIGTEDAEIIAPLIEELHHEGFEAFGPRPADSVYVEAMREHYDGVLAMYHDQGLIPVKLLAFDSGVNCTANLSIVRTSPDHGTAYDIAGEGTANEGAMLAAIELADAISRRRKGEWVNPTIAEQRLQSFDSSRTHRMRSVETTRTPTTRIRKGLAPTQKVRPEN